MKKNWLAVIHVAQLQLNLSDELYRTILKERYGVNSAKDLAPAQGEDLINHFKTRGFKPLRRQKRCTFCAPRPPRETIPTNIVYPVSDQQMAMIQRIRDDIRWGTSDGFIRWLKKYFGIIEIKTSIQASQAIYALKGLWRSQHKCKCSLMDAYLKGAGVE